MSEFNNRGMLFKSEDLIKEIQYEKNAEDTFKIKAIFPTDVTAIARLRAARQQGIPASQFTDNELELQDMEASIEFAVVEYPEWCDPPGPDGIRDTAMRAWLAVEINKWSNEWQTRLKKNKRGSNKGSTKA